MLDLAQCTERLYDPVRGTACGIASALSRM